MSKIFRQFLIASAMGIVAVGASAQSTSTMPSTTMPKAEQTQAERDHEAAKAVCQSERSRTARLECLRRADDAYNHATGAAGNTPLSGAGATGAGTPSGGGSNSAKQHP